MNARFHAYRYSNEYPADLPGDWISQACQESEARIERNNQKVVISNFKDCLSRRDLIAVAQRYFDEAFELSLSKKYRRTTFKVLSRTFKKLLRSKGFCVSVPDSILKLCLDERISSKQVGQYSLDVEPTKRSKKTTRIYFVYLQNK